MFRWSPRPSRQEATVNRGRDCEPRPRGTRRERSEMQGAGVQKCAALRVCLLWRGLTAFLTKKTPRSRRFASNPKCILPTIN